MPVKITNTTSATYSDMASGIVWATDHGARVINVSYAGTSSSSTLDSAVSYATNHGALVVVAAGNSGCNCPTYPANSPGAIAVAASDQTDDLMNYSNFGSWVDVSAPTGYITTWLTINRQPYGYGPVGGTSISAPVVSGIIALMLSFDPGATPTEMRTLSSQTSTRSRDSRKVVARSASSTAASMRTRRCWRLEHRRRRRPAPVPCRLHPQARPSSPARQRRQV